MERFSIVAVVFLTASSSQAGGDITDDLVVVEAAPLAEKIPPMKPTWCELATSNSYSTGALNRAMQRGLNDGWSRESTQAVAEAVCVNPDLPGYQKQTASFLQVWVNMTGMPLPEVVESIRQRMNKDAFENGRAETCNGLVPARDLPKHERSVIMAQRELFGCDGAPQWQRNDSEDLRAAFEGSPTHPLLLLYEVRQCLHDFESPRWEMGYDHLFRYAVCKPAIARLDRAALLKYADDAKLNAFARLIATESFSVAVRLGARYAELAKGQIAQNAGFAPVFAAGEKAWSDWEKLSADNAAAFEAGNAYRKLFYGPSKKARAGCFDALRDQLGAALAARKPKTLEEAQQAQRDSLGYNLTAALMLCAAADGQSVYSNMLNASAGFSRYPRGPRAAAYYAVVDAIGEVRADQDRFPMKPGFFAGENFYDLNNDASSVRESGSFGSPVEGIVEKTEKKGSYTKVTFKKTSYMATMLACKDTNRIARVDPGGQIIYRQDCVVSGQQKTDSTVVPLVVPAWASKGLSKGGLARFYCSDQQAEGLRLCFTTAAFADKSAKTLTNYLGVGLSK